MHWSLDYDTRQNIVNKVDSMTEITIGDDSVATFHRDQSACKCCGEIIEIDVPACPHCRNQPAALTKWGCVAIMFMGTILAVSTTHMLVMYWPGSLTGIVLFCTGASLYWIVTERYSPTKHDATSRISYYIYNGYH